MDAARTRLMRASNMFNAARVVGDALREIHQRDADDLKEHGHEFNGTFILGGQIKGEEPRLFHIYSAGNFIESSIDTPYFQIGESKYGKPIIDRVITRSSSLAQAAKCALVSMDSTIRSNLIRGAAPRSGHHPARRIQACDAYQHRHGQTSISR